MKYSKQREIIKRLVLNNEEHPSAHDLYQGIRKDYPHISLATVYRNLNLLAEEGLIRKIENSYGSDRFDFQTMPHHHMFCKTCGDVYDLNLEELKYIENQIKQAFGFEVTDFHIEGECQKCKSKN